MSMPFVSTPFQYNPYIPTPQQVFPQPAPVSKPMITAQDYQNMSDTIALSKMAAEHDLFPIAAMIVDPQGRVVAKTTNTELDPSSPLYGTPIGHAEVSAIVQACHALGTHDLKGYRMITSCEPCPMCLAAMEFAGIKDFIYANGIEDTDHFKQYGFNDKKYYAQASLPVDQREMPGVQLLRDPAYGVLQQWQATLHAKGIDSFEKS